MRRALIDKETLADEINATARASAAANSSLADGLAGVVHAVIRHAVVRIAAELDGLHATDEALAAALRHLPARFAELEARVAAIERAK
jgi:hypothetical protein